MSAKAPTGITYTDRFGHTWRVQARRAGDEWILAFRNRDVELVGPEPVASPPRALGHARLKDAFCDAERVLRLNGETWYVGYRPRGFGQRGHAQGGLCTRFRSESGEVRYSREMVDFRHVSAEILTQHLAEAAKNGGPRGSAGARR